MIPGGLAVYLATEPTDMRRSIDGLCAAVKERLAKDAMAERALFVFVNGKRDRLKVLWRDRTGFCLLYKRLDARRVALPKDISPGAASVTVDARTLAVLLDGVETRKPTTREIVRQARAKVSKSTPKTEVSGYTPS